MAGQSLRRLILESYEICLVGWEDCLLLKVLLGVKKIQCFGVGVLSNHCHPCEERLYGSRMRGLKAISMTGIKKSSRDHLHHACSSIFFFNINLFTYLFIYLFIYLFMAALGLRCCTQAFSSCGERGLLFGCGSWPSHCSGFSCCRARALGVQASAVVAHGL